MHQFFFALGFAQFTLSKKGIQGKRDQEIKDGIYDEQVPVGPQGLQGLQGLQGPQGPQGRDASLLSFWDIITNWRYIAVSGITYTGMTFLFIKCVMG